jgi:hypothetical protein
MVSTSYELLSTDVYPVEPPDPSVEYVAPFAKEYFARPVRRGLFVWWEVWWRHGDCRVDAGSSAICWRALWGVRFWRRINAMRCAADMAHVHKMSINDYRDWKLSRE